MSDDAKTIRELKETLANSMAAREKVEATKMVKIKFIHVLGDCAVLSKLPT